MANELQRRGRNPELMAVQLDSSSLYFYYVVK